MDLGKMHTLDIVLLCGLYGSGKTSFAVRNFKGRDRSRISRSEIRKLMFEMTNFGDPWSADSFNEGDDALAKHIERKLCEHLLFSKKKILVINTFVSRKSRKRFVELAREMHKTVGAIFLNTPLERCFQQNDRNAVKVPHSVINSLFNHIELPAKDEGFAEVLIVSPIEE